MIIELIMHNTITQLYYVPNLIGINNIYIRLLWILISIMILNEV